MKSIYPILLVVLLFGTVSLLAAQENQPMLSPNAPPAVATTASASGGVISEPSATSGDPRLVTAPTEAGSSLEPGGADSENKPVLDRNGNPDAAQNVIEYGGPG